MKTFKIVFFASILLPVSVVAGRNHTAVRARTLLQASSSWDGTPYKAYPSGRPQLSVVRITIPAHTTLAMHIHPMPMAAYVLSGELTVEKMADGKVRHFTAGQALAEVVNAAHRGVTGNAPVTLIVFYAGVKGMHLSASAHP
jgi:quercetin dioxygenase-like cupin family protein